MGNVIEVKSLACPECGEVRTYTVSEEMHEKWLRDEVRIQEAFPGLTSDDRERFLTGLHGDCWDAYLGPEPEEDYDWEEFAEYGHDYYDEYYEVEEMYPEDYDPYC